jgi:chlorite dismutase
MDVLQVNFVGSSDGEWNVTTIHTLCGETLAPVAAISRFVDSAPMLQLDDWMLRSFTSNLRYTTASEARRLAERQQGLGRPASAHAALIPIRKTADWWALPQDERRAIYEERSRHTSIGMDYLPRIARKLHHCRDLGEPFDFLTWFEFAPEDSAAFDELVGRLRETEEWDYIDREIDIRLVHAG